MSLGKPLNLSMRQFLQMEMKDLKWVVLNFLSCSKEGIVRNALYGNTVDNVD